MSTAAKITVDLETRTAGWTKGLDGAGKETVKWVKDIQGQFKSLTFDKGQNFNAGGAAKFADALKKVAGEAEEVATALRTGKGYGEAFSDAVNAIPIVGAFKQAGESIRELITGEKAARVEAEKLTQHLFNMADGYRAIARERAGFGKFGDEKAAIDIENRKNAELDKLSREAHAGEMQMREIKRHDAYLHLYSDAQKAAMKRLEDERKLRNERALELEAKAEDEMMRLKREAAIRQHEFLFNSEIEKDQLEAKMREKTLRREGKALESAMDNNRRIADLTVKMNLESIRDDKLAGLSTEEKDVRRIAVRESNAAAMREMRANNAELTDIQHKKDLAQEQENIQKMKELQASANIEHLKMQDEATNARNEKSGIATRSHLAEVAQIEEDFRKQGAELIKKNRAENEGNLNIDDNFRAQLRALRAERSSKLDLLNEKSGIETARNQEATLKEQRRLWEEVGTPAEKYAAHLAEINEQFEKYHDLSLKNAEIKDLDKKTFAELKRLNPDHETPIQLYGRTGSFADVKVGGEGTAIAQQQLEAMKRQAAHADTWQVYFRDIWDWIRKQSAGVVPELNI